METHEIDCPNCGATIVGHLAPNEDQAGDTPVTVWVTDNYTGGGKRTAATPAAQRTAAAKGVDLAEVKGTGAKREVVVEKTVTKPAITTADVNKAAEKQAAEESK